MSPGGATDRGVEYPLVRDGNLKLDHASSVNCLCNLIVPFQAAARESQGVGDVGPTSPTVWHQMGHIGDRNRPPSTKVSTKKVRGPERSPDFLVLLRLAN